MWGSLWSYAWTPPLRPDDEASSDQTRYKSEACQALMFQICVEKAWQTFKPTNSVKQAEAFSCDYLCWVFKSFFLWLFEQNRCVQVSPDLCIDFLWYIHWRSSVSARQNSEAIKRLIGLTFSNITERFRSQENRRQMKKLSPWRLSWSRAQWRERCLAALPSEFRIVSTFEAQNTEICALVKNCVSPRWLLLPIIHLQLNRGLFISSWDLFKV